ncbi:MAG: PQQ-binding-like beta-propeller repeat protein, partial [Candidatus Omnitrophica bacterium]|nr:PQQ-binding-like beta-propeller repeat protein [Candidatus Omnitrophota bacterium]
MRLRMGWILAISVWLHPICATTFEDPAPPEFHPLENKTIPAATVHPDVTFHGLPKRLSPDAATTDWTCFLGPTHDGYSKETNLLKDWGNEGPSLVWEMEKGDGYSAPSVQGDRLLFFHRVGDEVRLECLNPENGDLYWRHGYPTRYRDRYGYNNGPRCSPVIEENRVYAYGAEGILICLDIRNGHVYWERNLGGEFKVPQDFFGVASTPLIEGNLLIVNVGAPGGPCVAAFDKMDGEMIWGVGDQWGPSYASPIPATIGGRRRIFVFAGGDSDPPTGGLLGIDPNGGSLLFRYPWRSTSYESVNASSPLVIGDRVF